MLGPGSGDQACGEVGDGRMLEPEELLEDIVAFFQPAVLAERRVLITAGPTFEAIDPVRGITNRSSGKMGFAIARGARGGCRGAPMVGPTALPTPRGVARSDVQSARQMHDAVLAGCTAATFSSRWRPWPTGGPRRSPRSEESQRHRHADTGIRAEPDILAAVAARPDAPYCCGLRRRERPTASRSASANAPLLVGNIGHHTFGLDDNEIVLFDAQGMIAPAARGQLTLARLLVAAIAQRLPAGTGAAS